MGELAMLNATGDTKLYWSAGNTDEVANARRTFNDLRAKGHLAYKLSEDGTKGEMLLEFDPMAQRIILAPAMKGG